MSDPPPTADATDPRSAARLRAVVEGSRDLIIVRDVAGRCLLVNPAAAAYLGRLVGEMEGRPLDEFLGAAERQWFQASDARVLRDARPESGELTLNTPSGPRVFEVAQKPYRGPDQALIGVMSVGRDVTADRLNAERLRRSEAALAEAQRITRLGSWETTIATGETTFSDELYRVLGHQPGGIRAGSEAYLAHVVEESRAELSAEIAQAVAERRAYAFDATIRRTDGALRIIHTRGHAVYAADGAPLRLLGTAQDVTEARRAAAALQASEARFRSVVSSAGEGIILSNAASEIILWNPSDGKLFGYDMTETLGRPMAMLFPEPHQAVHERWMALALAGEAIAGEMPYVIDGRRKDGSVFPLEINLSMWESGGERYVTALLRDIADRRAVERMKDEFIAMISHELRTPLNTITCSLDMLSMGVGDSNTEQARRLIEIAQSNTDRLARIVEDLLDLQRIEQGRVALVPGFIDVAALLREAIETIQPMADRREVAIDVVVDLAPSRRLWADPVRLHQILVNLLVNAIRYSPRGGQVVIAAAADRTHVQLRVTDQGPGVPPEHRELVFERFYQAETPPEGQPLGTGLGLAIGRSLVVQHGGLIWVEEAPGGGAAFVVELPLGRH